MVTERIDSKTNRVAVDLKENGNPLSRETFVWSVVHELLHTTSLIHVKNGDPIPPNAKRALDQLLAGQKDIEKNLKNIMQQWDSDLFGPRVNAEQQKAITDQIEEDQARNDQTNEKK